MNHPDQVRARVPCTLEEHRSETKQCLFSLRDNEVIHGITLDIEPGQVTALVEVQVDLVNRQLLLSAYHRFLGSNEGSVSIGGQILAPVLTSTCKPRSLC